MSFSTITLVVNTGAGSNTNVTYSLSTADYADAVSAVQNGMRNGGFWIANVAAGVTYNQFIPASAVLSVTIT